MEANQNNNQNESTPHHDEHHFQNNETAELAKKNKILTYALIGLGALLIIGTIAFFATRKKTEDVAQLEYTTPVNHPANVFGDSVAVDSTMAVNEKLQEDAEYEYEGEEYEPYSQNYVIANEAMIRTAPSETAATTANRLKFGDKVYVDNSYEGTGNYSKVYFSPPGKNKTQTPYYVTSYVLTYEGNFEEFKKYFSLKPFASLATKTKRLILDNNYSNSRRYELTQNLERSKSAISYGDFDNDGIQDVAVLMDNNEDQYSRLLIIGTNAATKDPYLAYAENYSDKMRINSFKKNAKIFMNSSSLVNSPADGLILNAADAKIALVYDKSNQKFKSYYQDGEYSEADYD